MDKGKSLIKPLLALAGPIILANFFQAAYQLTDAFWVGRLGEKAVAAVAVSMPIIFFMTSLGIGFAVAGGALTAQYFGAKDEKMVSHSSAQTLLLVIVVSAIASTLGYFFSANILKFLGVSSEIFETTLAYLRISFLGMIFNFSFFMFQSIMRSIGKPKLPVFIVIGTVILNFILDPLLMFGIWFIPKLGVAGTAWATLFTQSIAAVIGLFILFSGQQGIKLHWPDFKPDFKFLRRTLWLGLPSSLEQSARSLVLTVMTGLITSFGTLAIAAYGVGSNIFQLILMLCFGFAGANSALVGQNLGANNPKKADQIARLSLKLIFITLSTFGVIIFIFAPHFISFFVPNDINVITQGAHFLRFIALTSGLTGIQVIVGSTLQASGSTKQSMILTIISQWIIQLPLAYLLSRFFHLGLNGVWIALPATSVIMSIIYLSVFLKGKWKTKKLIGSDEKIRATITQEVKVDEIIALEN